MFEDVGDNSLFRELREAWNRLSASAGLNAILVLINARLSAKFRRPMTAADIMWLCCGNGTAEAIQWRDPTGFRLWLLTPIHHVLRDVVDQQAAVKRWRHSETVGQSSRRFYT
jgi:hypothetical protein